MLAILEGLGNFIKHGVSFLFLPTDFQALSFTSPQMTAAISLPDYRIPHCKSQQEKMPTSVP
jgi:hypothetical protein